MKKNLLKTGALCMTLLMLPITNLVKASELNTSANSNIYEKYTNIDLQCLDLDIVEDSLIINNDYDKFNREFASPTITNFNLDPKISATNSNGIIELNALQKLLADNPQLEKQIVDNIKNGNEVIAVSSKEVYVEETYNPETDSVESRLLTIEEVNELNNKNSVQPGQPGGNGKLTLNSILVANPSLVGYANTYSLSTTASWDLSRWNNDGYQYPATGDDFIGFTWPSSYSYCGRSSMEGTYYNSSDPIKFYMTSINGNGGMAYGFTDVKSLSHINLGAGDINGFAHIAPSDTSASYKTFSSEYIHTYEKTEGSLSLEINPDGVSTTITLSNVEKQWTAVSPVTAYVK